MILFNIKSFILNITKNNVFSSTYELFRRTREKFKNILQISWSENWAIDKFDFRKTMIQLKKKTDLFNNFKFNHFKKSFKINIIISVSSLIFASSILKLSKTLFLFNSANQFFLIDQILKEKAKFRSFITRLIVE